MLRALRRGWRRPRWLNRLLYPLSLGYAFAMRLRRIAYRAGILRRHALPVPLIVVGNLSVGGVGKTPLVMELVARLQRRGFAPGVISRGYRRGGGGGGGGRETREVGEHSSAAEVGDEPLLIARRCRAPVAVGASRLRSARWLIEERGCNILVSDDGFQHHALRRDLDIVVVDGERRFGNGWCLPAGPLREPPGALGRADLVVVNGDANDTDEFNMTTRIAHAVCIADGRRRELGEFAGQAVHALAAIGNPRRFFRQLQGYGIDVVAHPFPDHHPFTAADIEGVAAGDDAPLLMTEKDAVKCEPLVDAQLARRCWVAPLRVTLGAGLDAAVFARLDARAGGDRR